MKSRFVALACLGACCFSPCNAIAEPLPQDQPPSFDGKFPAVLAKGQEISRGFPGGAVLLRFRSSPVFGDAPENWSVAQVGPLALAFLQEGGKGRIGVLRGEQTEILGEEFVLDVAGRASAALEVIIGFDPFSGTAVQAIGGKIFARSGIVGAWPLEVTLAAGASGDWKIEELTVLVVDEAQANASGASRGDAAGAASANSQSAALDKVFAALRPVPAPAASHTVKTSDGAPHTERKASPAGNTRLEISTPPAVRRSAGKVRAIVAQSINP